MSRQVPAAQRPPQIADRQAAAVIEAEIGLGPDARLLLARAVQFTRVSYFTADERRQLGALVTRVTGYVIEGGL